MTGIIFAIMTCTATMCMDDEVRFRTAEDCLYWLEHRMGHKGPLTNGRIYNPSRTVWLECDQKPTSEWTPVQPKATEHLVYAIFICNGNMPCAVGGQGKIWYWPTEETCIGQLRRIKADWDRIPNHNETVIAGSKLHVVGSDPSETFECVAMTVQR